MSTSLTHLAIRPDWLAAYSEAAIEPLLPILDAHHHLYDRPGIRYLFDDYLGDLNCGHNVRASVYVQARSMLRADGPPEMRPVGETEFANGVAAMSASGLYGDVRVCAGIVSAADLMLGDSVRPVLERHITAAGGTAAQGGRFCGIRHALAWDPNPALLNPAYPTTADMSESPVFRVGFAHLAPLGLSFEAWAFFHQLPAIAALARAFPDTRIVLNHCGGVVRIGDYTGQRDQVFEQWRRGIQELAKCSNVCVKLSGLGMRFGGFGFEDNAVPPGSGTIAEAWRPWIETCVTAFSADRCMFASNFPVDKASFSYVVGLNALKRLVAGTSDGEKASIFWRTAIEFYRLSVPSRP